MSGVPRRRIPYKLDIDCLMVEVAGLDRLPSSVMQDVLSRGEPRSCRESGAVRGARMLSRLGWRQVAEASLVGTL
jgi:hypothetical protein